MAFKKDLLKNQRIKAGETKRLLPSLPVENYDRLHFHVSNGVRAVDGLRVSILFGTPVDGVILLSDSTVWFEETLSEREFSFSTPTTYNGTGFVMSVPVIAPLLYDVILQNIGSSDLEGIYVSVMAQTM